MLVRLMKMLLIKDSLLLDLESCCSSLCNEMLWPPGWARLVQWNAWWVAEIVVQSGSPGQVNTGGKQLLVDSSSDTRSFSFSTLELVSSMCILWTSRSL